MLCPDGSDPLDGNGDGDGGGGDGDGNQWIKRREAESMSTINGLERE